MPKRTGLFLLLATAMLPIHGVKQINAVPIPEASRKETHWPMLGGSPARNMVNLIDRDVPIDWCVEKDKERNILWQARLGLNSHSCPVIAGGKVFIGTNNENPRNRRDRGKSTDDDVDGPPLDKGILLCFEEKSGKFLWQAVHDKLEDADLTRAGLVGEAANGADWPRQGIVSTPCVDGKRVYYVTSGGIVICADTEGFHDGVNDGVQDEKYKDEIDADIVWRYDMIREQMVHPHCLAACSPLIVGDRVFIVTGNGVGMRHVTLPSPDAPSFIALDKNSSKFLWMSHLPGKNIMHGQWSSPAYGVFKQTPTIIFPGGDGWLYGLKPENGELIWKFDANPKDSKYELGGRSTKSEFIGATVAYKERIFIGTGQDPEHFEGVGHFWCIEPAGKSGDISPDLVTDAAAAPPKTRPNPNSGVVWHYGGEETHKFARRDYVFGRTLSTACIVDDVVYISEIAGYLHCIDARSGKRYWVSDARSSFWGSCYYVDGKVYIGNEDGELFIFKHEKQPLVLDEVAEAALEANEDAAARKRLAVRHAVKSRCLIAKIQIDEPIRTTPTVANGVLYIPTERSLFAISHKRK